VTQRNLAIVRTLTYAMFAMFAMTTDSVGIIIPEVIRTFRLSLTAAGSFQYATMGGIAIAAMLLGQLADRIGRRRTIITGLTLFAAACFLITIGNSFVFFAVLLGLSGIAIGVFKTGALALIGDLVSSTSEHTSIMNMLEGFFGVGAIVGPLVLARLLGAGLPWTRLYLLAGAMCVILIVVASLVRYPETARSTAASSVATGTSWKNPYVLAFSTAAFLYVGVEAAVYVWMPTLLAGYSGSAVTLAAYAVSIFFVLRAAGRFLGAWLLTCYRWQPLLAVFSGRSCSALRRLSPEACSGRCTRCRCRGSSCPSCTRRSTRRGSVVCRRPSTAPAPVSSSSSRASQPSLLLWRSGPSATPSDRLPMASGLRQCSPPCSSRACCSTG
jgi:fucose permease